MKQQEINIKYQELNKAELSETEKLLYERANSVILNSYSKYSHFAVSCALLLDNGEIITGTNQENAAFPSGLCAERIAVFYAKSQYPDAKIKSLLITAKRNGVLTEQPVTPCGACLQVLIEAEKRQGCAIEMIFAGTSKIYKMSSVKSCLPMSFTEF